ncbi:cation:proton antiporter [Cyanobium sp. NIES-981]|uniref:cation:proton antiporter n=1 Tax=Cyanobium sp. NIES-981 TaxID=1851505 RepID=UPI0012FAB744|nr:cation:proton antiporter [Cyanobium sp. NIES-981]
MLGALVARLTAKRMKRWAVPALVLELLVGFLLGNTVLPFSRIQPLSGITDLGVLTLFFLVGLEVRGGLLGPRPGVVLRLVLLSALTPLLAWWPLKHLFNLAGSTTVLFLAVLSATGTGVTLRALSQGGALQTPSGQLLVGVSVLDDLPAILLLMLATLLGSATGAPGEANPAAGNALLATGLVLAVMALSFPLCRWWRSHRGRWTPDALGVMLVLAGSSWLGEVSGLTSLLGALWGGMLLRQLLPEPGHAQLGPGLHSPLALLSDVFLPLYFLSVGLSLEAASLLEPSAWGMATVLFLVAVLCKLICGVGISQSDEQAGV